MVKRVSDQGGQVQVPEDHIIEVSYSKAKQLMKKPREMSEKQRENIQRLVAMNKQKREAAKAEKEAQQQQIQQQQKMKQVIVKPKRVFKKKTPEPIEEESEYDDESEEEYTEVEPPKPAKRAPPPPPPAKSQPQSKLVEMENKLKQIEQSIKPNISSRYDSMLNKFWGKK